jgi:hypothetical protein
MEKIDIAKSLGFSVNETLTINSPLDDLERQVFSIASLRKQKTAIITMQSMLLVLLGGLETAAGWIGERTPSFKIRLNGLSQTINDDIKDYEMVLGELYEENEDKIPNNPWFTLLVMIAHAAKTQHEKNLEAEKSLDEEWKREQKYRHFQQQQQYAPLPPPPQPLSSAATTTSSALNHAMYQPNNNVSINPSSNLIDRLKKTNDNQSDGNGSKQQVVVNQRQLYTTGLQPMATSTNSNANSNVQNTQFHPPPQSPRQQFITSPGNKTENSHQQRSPLSNAQLSPSVRVMSDGSVIKGISLIM